MDISVLNHKKSDAVHLQGAVTNLSIICNSNYCNCCPIGEGINDCPYQLLLRLKNDLLKEIEGE